MVQAPQLAGREKAILVVLGAGRPFRGDRHAALQAAYGGASVLDWTLQAVANIASEVVFVGGYQVEEVSRRYPDIQYTINPEWESTGAATSLLGVPLNPKKEYYVSYADILFRDDTVRRMADAEGSIVVAVDSLWRQRFEGRTAKDMARCEKVYQLGEELTRLGPDINPALAEAEFIGLVRFTPEVVAYLRENSGRLGTHLRRANLSQLIEILRMAGFRVGAVDVAGDWAELNESRDLAHFVLGTKAQTLHRLRQLVRKCRIEDQVSFTVEEWTEAPEPIIARVRESFVGQRLVVRSSALSEDGFTTANAGVYTSVLKVDGDDGAAIRGAITEVVASYPAGTSGDQVLVQPMVEDVRASGVAFTRTLTHGAPYYVVNYDDVTFSTDSITGGNSRTHKMLFMHRDETDALSRVPGVLRGLLPAMREIEELLGYDSLDIEFAVNGDDLVHVLQVRPIAVVHESGDESDAAIGELIEYSRQRFRELQHASPFVVGRRAFFGVMPDWNPAEIIGTRPGRLAMSLYRYLIMDEVWATQRAEYGYRDVRPQPLLVAFAGHPYVDIRASFNSLVPARVGDALAERLVDFYSHWLEVYPHLHDKVEFDVVPTCYGLDFPNWAERLQNEGGFTADEIAELGDALRDITCAAFDRDDELRSIDMLEQRLERIQAAELPPLDRALLLLVDCRRYGTLPFAHLARSGFVAVTLLRSAVATGIIDQPAMDAFLGTIRTVTHRFTHDAAATAAGRMVWDDFVTRYGHLRPGTYDITSPSYGEDPEHFLRPVVESARHKIQDQVDDTAWQAVRGTFVAALGKIGLPGEMERVERFMRAAIEGREYAKFVFTRNLSAALTALAEYGVNHGLSREELSNIPWDDFISLRAGGAGTGNVTDWLRDRVQEGARARQRAAQIELPPLLLEEGDFGLFLLRAAQANFVSSGRVRAEIIDLGERSDTADDLVGRIVLIPQADPGYDWLFGRNIGALITMYGGANSHMAIRAAEFGLPAAVGVGETEYQRLASASMLELDAGNRRITVIR